MSWFKRKKKVTVQVSNDAEEVVENTLTDDEKRERALDEARATLRAQGVSALDIARREKIARIISPDKDISAVLLTVSAEKRAEDIDEISQSMWDVFVNTDKSPVGGFGTPKVGKMPWDLTSRSSAPCLKTYPVPVKHERRGLVGELAACTLSADHAGPHLLSDGTTWVFTPGDAPDPIVVYEDYVIHGRRELDKALHSIRKRMEELHRKGDELKDIVTPHFEKDSNPEK